MSLCKAQISRIKNERGNVTNTNATHCCPCASEILNGIKIKMGCIYSGGCRSNFVHNSGKFFSSLIHSPVPFRTTSNKDLMKTFTQNIKSFHDDIFLPLYSLSHYPTCFRCLRICVIRNTNWITEKSLLLACYSLNHILKGSLSC